ncbi:MAG: hypothetical protein J5654_12950 [Victivallales bacterium]|nr:hypothetical protein [Victivallales bacterium]
MRTFFAYLDVLGFKHLFDSHQSPELHQCVNELIHVFNSAIWKSLECPNVKKDKIYIEHENISDNIELRLLSDSILIWCKKPNERSFCMIVEAIQQLLFWGIKKGKPLRGVLTYGDIFLVKSREKHAPINNEAIYGKALIRAYRLEGEMQWSGCIVTPQAWTKLKRVWQGVRIPTDTPNGLFNYVPRLVWYSVPFKNSVPSQNHNQEHKPVKHQKCIAIDWNTELFDQPLQAEDFSRCFQSEEGEVQLKATETSYFYNETKRIHSLHKNRIQRSRIPIPKAKYSIRDVGHKSK